MRKIAMIPARYAATRFPFKLMQPLGNKTVIRHARGQGAATCCFIGDGHIDGDAAVRARARGFHQLFEIRQQLAGRMALEVAGIDAARDKSGKDPKGILVLFYQRRLIAVDG